MSGGDVERIFDFELYETTRNGEMIFYSDYFYIKYHAGKECHFWRCQDRKCKAKLSTFPLDKIEKINLIGQHNHFLSENDILHLKLSKKINELARNTAYNTHTVYSVATQATPMSQLPILKKHNIYENIRNLRKRNSIAVDTTRNLQQLNIQTLRGEDFCLFDSGVDSDDRIVILSTVHNFCHLKNSNCAIADGTFKVCPKEFTQLYVITRRKLSRARACQF